MEKTYTIMTMKTSLGFCQFRDKLKIFELMNLDTYKLQMVAPDTTEPSLERVQGVH